MMNMYFSLVLLVLCVAVSQGSDISGQCKGNTPCFGMSGGLECSDLSSCKVMSAIQANADKTKFDITLVGTADSNSYVALGIAEDGSGMMNTHIVVCSKDSVGLFWATDTSSPPSQLKTHAYFSSSSSSLESGKITCKFQLDSTFTTENGKTFNLATKNYAILLAQGKYDVASKSPKQHESNGRVRIAPASLVEKKSTPTTPTEGKGPSHDNSSSHLATSYLVVLSLLGLRIWLV